MQNSKHNVLTIVIAALIALSCSPGSHSSGKKRFVVKPVCLSISGIENVKSLRKIFEEAFASYRIEIITSEEMQVRVQSEITRVQQRLAGRKDEFKGKSAADITKAVQNEIRYVSNMLSISLVLEEKDDSLMIYKASWRNVPFPPDFSRLASTVPSSREINLTRLSYALRENIFSIVDSILYSNELK